MTVVAVMLERNPEVNFSNSVNVKEILEKAVEQFKASSGIAGSGDKVWEAFYAAPTDQARGTFSFIAKAVCGILLDNDLDSTQPTNDCGIM